MLPSTDEVELRPCVIDLNRASAAELQVLPGIGAQRAQAIVLRRIRSGRFSSPRDLLGVDGIGDDTVRRLLPFVACGAPAAR